METDISEMRQERTREGFYFAPSLLSAFEEIDLSSVYPRFEKKDASVRDDIETSWIKGDLRSRISKVVDDLMKGNEVFKNVNKAKLIEFLSPLLETLSSEQLKSITDDELTLRIEKIMSIEAITGILNDLSSAQMESFEAAIKRKEFFNGLYR